MEVLDFIGNAEAPVYGAGFPGWSKMAAFPVPGAVTSDFRSMPKWRIRTLEAKILPQTAALQQNGADHRCIGEDTQRSREKQEASRYSSLEVGKPHKAADMDGEEVTAATLAQEEASGGESSSVFLW